LGKTAKEGKICKGHRKTSPEKGKKKQAKQKDVFGAMALPSVEGGLSPINAMSGKLERKNNANICKEMKEDGSYDRQPRHQIWRYIR